MSDSAKFHPIVAALDMSVLNEITEIIKNPSKGNKYAELKSKLNRLAEYPEDALTKALSDLEFSDSGPTQLLRRMRYLVGEQLSQDTLRMFLVKKLPTRVREILSVTAYVDFEAQMADKILREKDSPYVVAITPGGNASELGDPRDTRDKLPT